MYRTCSFLSSDCLAEREEPLRHAHVQLLDQPAVEHHHCRAGGRRRLEGGHHAARVLDLGRRRREGAVGHAERLRVDERLAVKAQRAALRAAALEAGVVGQVVSLWPR